MRIRQYFPVLLFSCLILFYAAPVTGRASGTGNFSALRPAGIGHPVDDLSTRKLDFDAGWRFHLGDLPEAKEPGYTDDGWRPLDLPHDWSIEGAFSKDNPAGVQGGALPGGIGWYRKTFTVPATDKDKLVSVEFDGVYMNSEVWINGHDLGNRPYGYSSFCYALTPYLHFNGRPNVIAVRVDNSRQPNSRWYSGSGIYRNVWLIATGKVHVDQWGAFVSTRAVSEARATVSVKTAVLNELASDRRVTVMTTLYDPAGKAVANGTVQQVIPAGTTVTLSQALNVNRPALWSTDNPGLYRAAIVVRYDGTDKDRYNVPFGIRYFKFDREEGFSLNGKRMKLWGVCLHHDLGCLGSAFNTRAMQRELQILKDMGCNAIRTSHNPPAPELLQLCDEMGFLVMDEAFDCWAKGKTGYDYHLYWDQWHVRDLSDMIRRDRNHPCVIIWSIGNEIPDQWDSAGTGIARELAGIVHSMDTTRPVTSATNDPERGNNFLSHSGALDLLGFNYNINNYNAYYQAFPGIPFIASETTSGLQTRGVYDMPSDTVLRWPPKTGPMNADGTCSAYDNRIAVWGDSHEATLKMVRKDDFVSGMFVWTGFDYLGEPPPYGWPSRSAYFGIVDLAGFPKDVYYLYKSVWTDKPVLHLFPHWNWKAGDTVDVWAYYNHADEVELFLNGRSLGTRRKLGDDLHVLWKVPFQPGTLKAVSKEAGNTVLEQEIHTAGPAARIILEPDRRRIRPDGRDLSYVTVKIVDADGNLVPYADNLIRFSVTGPGRIAGVDNGSETDHAPFKADYRKAFNGLCLAVVQSKGKDGTIRLTAASEGLLPATTIIAEKGMNQ